MACLLHRAAIIIGALRCSQCCRLKNESTLEQNRNLLVITGDSGVSPPEINQNVADVTVHWA